jgi:hypothetical protein
MFDRLGDLIPRELNKRGLKKTFTALEILEKFKILQKELFGEDSNLNVQGRFVKNGVLYIGVTDSSWAQTVFMGKIDIEKTLGVEIKVTQSGLKPLEYEKSESLDITSNSDRL